MHVKGMIEISLVLLLFFLSCCGGFVQSQWKQRWMHGSIISMISLTDINDRILMENAERIGRKEQSLVGSKTPLAVMEPLPLKSFEKRLKNGQNLVNAILLKDGCVSLKSVLSEDTALSLYDFVATEKALSEEKVAKGLQKYDSLFGAVNNRRNRADVFLPYDSEIVQKSLFEATENVFPLLNELEGMKETGMLHELSSFVSDPGSPNQCVHCDTPFLQNVKPLYTFFVALQDVDDDMGHTTYLPQTQIKEAHEIFNGPQKQKEELIANAKCVRSNLKIGDAAIFDSRVLHFGGANTSQKRRILFYFTFTAGDVQKNNPNPARGMGSIRFEDDQKYSWTHFANKIAQ